MPFVGFLTFRHLDFSLDLKGYATERERKKIMYKNKKTQKACS